MRVPLVRLVRGGLVRLMSRRGRLIAIAAFFSVMSVIFGVVSYNLWSINPADFLLCLAVGSLLATYLFALLSKDRDPLDLSWRGIDQRMLRYLIPLWAILGLTTLYLLKYLHSDALLFLAGWYTLGLGASITALVLSFIGYFSWRGDRSSADSKPV